jgi:transcriptional regulator
MYNPSHFQETRTEVLHGLIRQQPLAMLTTLTAQGLVANHIPMFLRADRTPYGTLVGHVARANALWREFDASVAVLAVFQGPQHYISPRGYATKLEHGKVVPTWNYVVVHARGPLQVHDDAVWIRQQLQDLTTQQEATAPKPWSVDDAPRDYTDKMISALVGISIPVTDISGKWKVSQNQPPVNQESLVQTLRQSGEPGALSMAELVQATQRKLPQ